MLNPTGTNINYASKYITFNVVPNVCLLFSITRNDGQAVRRKVVLSENIVLALGETKLVRANWRPLPVGMTFLMQANY